MNEQNLSQEASLTLQGVLSEHIEYIDIYIPIYRFADTNFWSTLGAYQNKDEAIAAIRQMSVADAKILIHCEKFIKFDSRKD